MPDPAANSSNPADPVPGQSTAPRAANGGGNGTSRLPRWTVRQLENGPTGVRKSDVTTPAASGHDARAGWRRQHGVTREEVPDHILHASRADATDADPHGNPVDGNSPDIVRIGIVRSNDGEVHCDVMPEADWRDAIKREVWLDNLFDRVGGVRRAVMAHICMPSAVVHHMGFDVIDAPHDAETGTLTLHAPRAHPH